MSHLEPPDVIARALAYCEALEAIERAAMPGPWEAMSDPSNLSDEIIWHRDVQVVVRERREVWWDKTCDNNHALIVAARNLLLPLVAGIRALCAVLDVSEPSECISTPAPTSGIGAIRAFVAACEATRIEAGR